MLDAEQYKRHFLAQAISLAYLFLVFSIFGESQIVYQGSVDTSEIATLTTVSFGSFSDAILPVRGDCADFDYLPKPSKAYKLAGVFSLNVTNHFYTNQWKHYSIQILAVPIVPVKRYLLFSCFRLSEVPLQV